MIRSVRRAAAGEITQVRSPLALVTMVYNEPEFLPVWAAHYRAQVGPAHCYVIDHGSDDGSVAAAALPNILPLGRSALDENWRARLVSHLCRDLLQRYDAVAYVDVDELLVADPRRFRGLRDLAAQTACGVLTAFGANVLHAQGEAPLDFGRKITAQRDWARPLSSLCKPVIARRPVQWIPGFHAADAPSEFGGLYLFHIAYADNGITARRQARRQTVPRSHFHGAHHAIPPEDMVHRMRSAGALPRDRSAEFGGEAEAGFLAALLRSGRSMEGGRTIASHLEAEFLWPIPPWLKGTF